MRLEGHEQSSNVEDRRGRRGPAMVGGGGIIVVLILLALKIFDAPPVVQQMAGQVLKGGQQRAANNVPADGVEGIDDENKVFVSRILKSTENVWTKLFKEQGDRYAAPRLVIFQDSVESGCGNASSATGPFYCPADQQVYIDPAFFDELATRFNAGGDFAAAYVIAHEIGHHVQQLTGRNRQANIARTSGDERMSNQMSVRLELQADYLAGVWAHYANKDYDLLEDGDIEEGINAANQIGDDKLQMNSQGYVKPERFTHGTSAQRARWFRKGLVSGRLEDCDELFRIDERRL